jgi:acyl-coenzyme A synthetase/AMP-(fatty) acid ligase
MSAVESILRFGRIRGEAEALVDGGRTVTYRELALSVRAMARALEDAGVKPAQRVGVLMKDTADHIVVLLAVGHLGGVAVSLDWRARAAENARFMETLPLDRVVIERDVRQPHTDNGRFIEAPSQGALDRVRGDPSPSAAWTDPFLISASSGSTGAPKFTQMTHLQFHFAVSGMLELMDLSGAHRFLCTMPLYYSGGRNSCLAHLLRGDCVVLYPSVFSPAEYVDVVTRHRITVAGLVPSVVRQLLAAAGAEPLLPGLAKLFSTGAPLHADEKRAATRKLTPHFHERYGTAETMVISMLRPADFAERADSVGQTHSLAAVEVVDEQDRPLPAQAVGRLRFRGPGMATPVGESATANFRDGWYYPGEIARLDSAGYLFLEGRSSEVIMRSGAKVHPAEVESVLCEHPGVLEAAVLGYGGDAGAGREDEVVAFVQPVGALTVGELILHCRIRLTPHKVPRKILIVPDLPRNTAGKIDKLALAGLLRGQVPAS